MVKVYPEPVTLPTTRTSAALLPALADALRGQTVEGVHIHDAAVELTDGVEGETVARVSLLVDDPQPGARTWPVETVQNIEWLARRQAWALGIGEWVFLKLIAVSEATEGTFTAAAIARAHSGRR